MNGWMDEQCDNENYIKMEYTDARYKSIYTLHQYSRLSSMYTIHKSTFRADPFLNLTAIDRYYPRFLYSI